jgi:hypothetical protein
LLHPTSESSVCAVIVSAGFVFFGMVFLRFMVSKVARVIRLFHGVKDGSGAME